jgi:hypothetical protein
VRRVVDCPDLRSGSRGQPLVDVVLQAVRQQVSRYRQQDSTATVALTAAAVCRSRPRCRTPAARRRPGTEPADDHPQHAERLTGSNRRPPPYHEIPSAAGSNQWQQNCPSYARLSGLNIANSCHRLRPLGSVTAPYDRSPTVWFEAVWRVRRRVGTESRAIPFRSNPACGSPPRSTCAPLVVVPPPEWSP